MVPQKSIIKTHYRNGPFHYSRGTPPVSARFPQNVFFFISDFRIVRCAMLRRNIVSRILMGLTLGLQ